MRYLIFIAFIVPIIAVVSSWPSTIECPLARLYNEETAPTATDSVSDVKEASAESIEPASPGRLGLSDDSDKLDAVVRSEEESEAEMNSQQFINKGKREVCEQLMEQIQNLPCDNPVMVTCGNNLPKPYFPCSEQGSRSSDPESEPQDLPADSVYPSDSSSPSEQPIPPSSGISQKDKGLFEGLLRFATVVNHIDTFITEKGKGFIRGLNRMVESEEDASF